MGGSQKGISFRDLLCGLVVLTKGELEEKIKCMLSQLYPISSLCTLETLVSLVYTESFLPFFV